MRLDQLHESRPDHWTLLRELAHELNLKQLHLQDIDKMSSDEIDDIVDAAIGLFRHTINTGKPSENYGKTWNAITNLATARLRDTDEVVQALRRLEELGGGKLSSVVGLADKVEAVENALTKARHDGDNIRAVWLLLNILNQMAMTTVKSNEEPTDTRYKAAIARAGLRKMGIEPVADEGV